MRCWISFQGYALKRSVRPALPLALLVSTLAHAQPESPARSAVDANAEGEIVVTGVRTSRAQIEKFVAGMSVESGDGQLARFDDEICPASVGLPPGYNAVIAESIIQAAREVGLRVGHPGCRPNVTLIVSNDGRATVRGLYAKRPSLFANLERSQLEWLLSGTAAARFWQATEPRGADGRAVQYVDFIDLGNGQPPEHVSGAYVVKESQGSRLQRSTRQDIAASFVVLDADSIIGKSLSQLAAYVAIRSFARTSTTPDVHLPTIAKLFDKDAGDISNWLTRWDLAYLRSLYLANNTGSASFQKSSMALIVARTIQTPPASAEDKR